VIWMRRFEKMAAPSYDGVTSPRWKPEEKTGPSDMWGSLVARAFQPAIRAWSDKEKEWRAKRS
jgi:hypothetical protein